jgi:hypothetical protein
MLVLYHAVRQHSSKISTDESSWLPVDCGMSKTNGCYAHMYSFMRQKTPLVRGG